MSIILIGFKRVGKTTYGQKLANKLHCDFVDSDHLVIEAYFKQTQKRKAVHQVQVAIGDKKFRLLEKEVLYQLEQRERVLAVGGGTVLNPESARWLKAQGTIVYLFQDKEITRQNLKKGRIPSFLDPDNFEETFERMYNERLPIYEGLADHILDISELSEKEILERLSLLAKALAL
ncbi:MAG: Shikimate kinase 2 [Chlamydiae bacterium]|nr:Shikimate kinase 2 [Chlamydiota bacterium]